MSEYDPVVAQKYTDLMAPAFVEGAKCPYESSGELSDEPLIRMAMLQPPIRERLAEVDWENSGLPTKQSANNKDFNEQALTPRQYAERLMTFAFDDAYQIIKLCELSKVNEALPEGASFRSLLLNGKESLLNIGHLPDSSRSDLFRYYKYPDLAKYFDGKAPPRAEEAIVLGQDNRANWRFEWHSEIKEYIQAMWVDGRGCPAFHYIVEHEGRNKTLMNYFWQKLVVQMYPEDSPAIQEIAR